MPNSQHVQKHVLVSESRKSDDRENEVHKHRAKSSSSTRLLRRDIVQIALYVGKLLSYTTHAENACNRRREIGS